MRPWENQFSMFLVHFPAVFATAFAVIGPIKPDCYHCLRIHIFVWKKCATVDKRQIAPRGNPVAGGHWKIFMCILDILGVFQPQSITLIGVNGRVGKGTCSGKIFFFFSFWHIKCLKQRHIGGFILSFILFSFYNDIGRREHAFGPHKV